MDRSKTRAVCRRVRAASRGVLCLLVGLVGLLWAPGLRAQSPDEHASHHPEKKSAAPATKSPAGMGAKPDAMSGMGGSSTAPASASKDSSGMGGKTEQAGGMGAMMKEMMGGPPQKELYPSLMALPNLSPEQRLQLQHQAEARAKVGAALLQQGMARMANPEANDVELQEGAAEARAGLKELESGQSARRALAEGRPPRAVALPWFQQEMNLAPPMRDEPRTLLGVAPFHLFTMALLIAFALVMVAMYFFKMRRAAALFGRLDSDSGSPPPGASPPLAGMPGPSSPGTPPEGKIPPPKGTPPKSAPTPPWPPVPATGTPVAPDTPPEGAAAVPLRGGDAAEIADRADELWQARGRPIGSPEIDWLRAEEELAKAPVTANWRGQLRVGSIVKETPSVKTFRLLPSPNDRFLPFTFVPGQFLNVAFSIRLPT